MKRILALLLTLLLCLPLLVACKGEDADTDGEGNNPPAEAPAATDWSSDGVLKILMIGNSFSDDTLMCGYEIARQMGVKKMKLAILYDGGSELSQHYERIRKGISAYAYRENTTGTWKSTSGYSIQAALAEDTWDFISLQQNSGKAGFLESDLLENMITELRAICAPETKIVWNMTWAYQQDTTKAVFADYNNDQMTMYRAITNGVQQKVVPESRISCITPVGTAIQNARTSFVGDKLTRDGYHINLPLGRLITGMTFLSALTGLPIDNVTYMPNGLANDANSKELLAIAIESAKNALAKPFEVTQSAYTEATVRPDSEKYTEIAYEMTALSLWNPASATSPSAPISDSKNRTYATQMFTPETLPVGSLIVIDSPWYCYTVQGWKQNAPTQKRSDEIYYSYTFEVTEAFWEDYTHRALNISRCNEGELTKHDAKTRAAVRIYVPTEK